MITKENDLTNQRMLWMAAFNGLLFAALGFAWDKTNAKFLTIVFSILGVSASFLNGIALIFASNAQRSLLFWWHSKKPKNYNGPGVMGFEPLDAKRYSLFLTPWILIAFIFTAGWLAILIFVLNKIP
jgi:lysylphosphatidylglycerol synthetase-like protein (DUF2156 family)